MLRIRTVLVSLLVGVLVAAPVWGAPSKRAAKVTSRAQSILRPRTVTRQAFSPKPVLRGLAAGPVGIFNRLARRDPFLRAGMEAVLRDAQRLIVGKGFKRVAGRAVWVPLASSRPMRRLLVQSIQRYLGERSNRIKREIAARPDQAVWDTVIIGAGVHGAAAASAASQENAEHRVLVVDRGDATSGNFGNLGETIAINSSNRAENGNGIQPFGQGNNNPAVGPVGVPDVTGAKWPAAEVLSDVATISLHTSGADVLARAGVKRIERVGSAAGAPKRYRVVFEDDTAVYANNVVVATGVGRPRIPVSDETGRRIVESETSRVDLTRPSEVPGIVFYDQALNLARLSAAPRDPYRAGDGKKAPRTAVIGGGDGGRTFLEFLYGLAPEGAYDGPGRLDRAQRGSVGKVTWIVGPKGPADCAQYLSTVRARYGRLAPNLKNGDTKLVTKSLTTIRRARRGGFVLVYSDGSKERVDRIVLAAGFEPSVNPLLADLVGGEERVAGSLGVVEEEVDTLRGVERRNVAKQLTDESIYLIGPAAGSDLVQRDETVGISENLASIKFLVPYSAALGRGLARRSKAGPPLPRFSVQLPGRTRVGLSSTRTQFTLELPEDRAPLPTGVGQDAFVLRLELAYVLDELAFDTAGEFSITFAPVRGQPQMRVSATLAAGGEEAVRDRIAANPTLMRYLAQFAAAGKALKVRVNVTEPAGGGPLVAKPETLRLQY